MHLYATGRLPYMRDAELFSSPSNIARTIGWTLLIPIWRGLPRLGPPLPVALPVRAWVCRGHGVWPSGRSGGGDGGRRARAVRLFGRSVPVGSRPCTPRRCCDGRLPLLLVAPLDPHSLHLQCGPQSAPQEHRHRALLGPACAHAAHASDALATDSVSAFPVPCASRAWGSTAQAAAAPLGATTHKRAFNGATALTCAAPVQRACAAGQ